MKVNWKPPVKKPEITINGHPLREGDRVILFGKNKEMWDALMAEYEKDCKERKERGDD